MRFTKRSTVIAVVMGMASALVGGCAMQSHSSAIARADTEDASRPSSDTTLTAQGDPVPEVATQVAAIEPAAPAVQVAQADPIPSTVQRDEPSGTPPVATTASTPNQPSSYGSVPAPGATSTSANTASGNTDEQPALPPRADRN